MSLARSWLIAGFVLILLIICVVIFVAVGSNSSRSSINEPNLSASSILELKRLPFCEVGKKLDVPAEIIAGVVIAEKQLNRDWSDSIQDGLFTLFAYFFGDGWWQRWSDRSLNLANENLNSRKVSSEWSKNVAWTGVIFSIGPSQITPRTALQSCQAGGGDIEWCGNTKKLIKTLLNDSGSIEVAALILKVERANHLEKTGIDISSDLGKWATLYNFGGDIFRARFKENPNRKPNGFGSWIANNQKEIQLILKCQ